METERYYCPNCGNELDTELIEDIIYDEKMETK